MKKKLEQKYGNTVPLLVFGNYEVVDEKLNPICIRKNNETTPYLNLPHMLVQSYITGCLICANKCLCKLMGDYDPRIQMHDIWAALIAISMGHVSHFNNILMKYRQHGNNVVGYAKNGKIKYIFSKAFNKKTKGLMLTYKKQAELLLHRYSQYMSRENKKTISDFINLFEYKSKIKRIFCLIDGNFLKNDFMKRFGQYWYV